MSALTTKQKRFAELYDGNGVQTAKEAGYQGSTAVLNQSAIKNLKNPRIIELIEGREEARMSGAIASREERQAFWTDTMYDSTESMAMRLQASSLLGKSEGDFISKTDIKVESEQKAIIRLPDITAKKWEEMFENMLDGDE